MACKAKRIADPGECGSTKAGDAGVSIVGCAHDRPATCLPGAGRRGDTTAARDPPAQSSFVRQTGFVAAAQELILLPGPDGLAGAVLGLGEDPSPYAFGNLAFRLPVGMPWRLEFAEASHEAAVLGFCLGAYRFDGLKQPSGRNPAQLLVPAHPGRAETEARAIWMVRDLINTPANLLGPEELAQCVAVLGRRYGASVTIHQGAALEAAYPTIAAVGSGSARRVWPACNGPAAPRAPTRSCCRCAARACVSTPVGTI